MISTNQSWNRKHLLVNYSNTQSNNSKRSCNKTGCDLLATTWTRLNIQSSELDSRCPLADKCRTFSNFSLALARGDAIRTGSAHTWVPWRRLQASIWFAHPTVGTNWMSSPWQQASGFHQVFEGLLSAEKVHQWESFHAVLFCSIIKRSLFLCRRAARGCIFTLFVFIHSSGLG